MRVHEDFQEYNWVNRQKQLFMTYPIKFLEAKLHTILFQSLLAEQAAQFLSMNISTRNAQSLLEASKVQCNKLRQSKITKEINELASSI